MVAADVASFDLQSGKRMYTIQHRHDKHYTYIATYTKSCTKQPQAYTVWLPLALQSFYYDGFPGLIG